MNFENNKLEIAIGALSVALFCSLGYFINGVKHKSTEEILDLVYQMPRPKSLAGEGFDLTGREVERQYVNPFGKKEAAKKAAQGLVQSAQPLTPGKAIANKKTNTKKAAAKGNVEVQVVEKSATGLSSDEESFSPAVGYQNQFAVRPAANSQAKADAIEKDKNQMSESQWRSLINAQPTAENVSKLVVAYGQQQITGEAFYAILTDLMANSKSEVQALAVSAAQATPSAKSFMFLSLNLENLSAEVAASADKVLASYSQNARQSQVMTVLASNEPVAVLKGIEVIVNGYQNAKTQDGGDRGDRGELSEQALLSYLKFIPVFKTLGKSADARVVEAASQALGVISVATNN